MLPSLSMCFWLKCKELPPCGVEEFHWADKIIVMIPVILKCVMLFFLVGFHYNRKLGEYMLRIQKEKKFFYSIYEHTLKFNHVFVLLMVPISYTDIFLSVKVNRLCSGFFFKNLSSITNDSWDIKIISMLYNSSPYPRALCDCNSLRPR